MRILFSCFLFVAGLSMIYLRSYPGNTDETASIQNLLPVYEHGTEPGVLTKDHVIVESGVWSLFPSSEDSFRTIGESDREQWLVAQGKALVPGGLWSTFVTQHGVVGDEDRFDVRAGLRLHIQEHNEDGDLVADYFRYAYSINEIWRLDNGEPTLLDRSFHIFDSLLTHRESPWRPTDHGDRLTQSEWDQLTQDQEDPNSAYWQGSTTVTAESFDPEEDPVDFATRTRELEELIRQEWR